MTEPGLARLRAWSHGRQQLGRAASDAPVALAGVVGVYSAHPTAPLALLARARALDAGAFTALEERREAVRIVAMRGSAFLVPLVLADRIMAATRDTGEHLAARLRRLGLDEATYRALAPRILEAAARPIRPAELRRALAAGAGDQGPYFAMRTMARAGLILRLGGDRLRTDDIRWVSTEAWLGRPLGQVDPDMALRWLADAYLRAYGPARVRDFAWWSGTSHGRAAGAIASVPAAEVGPGLLLPADQRAAWDTCRPLDPLAIDVLPKWDPYTMGHAPDGRGRLVDDGHLDRAYSTAATKVGATAGDGLPLLLQGGRAVATWGHRVASGRILVTVRPFEEAGASARALPDRAADAFSAMDALLAAPVEVTLAVD